MKKIMAIISLLILFLLTGCAERLGDFTVISTKNIDIGKNYIKVESDAIGTSTKQIIVIFPTGTPSIKDAVDDLLKKGNGDLVTNAVIHYNWYYIPYIYGEFSYEISGDIYKKAIQQVSMIENTNISKETLAQSDLQNADLLFTAEQKNGVLQLTQVAKNSVTIDDSINELTLKK